MDNDIVFLGVFVIFGFGYIIYMHNGWLWQSESAAQPYIELFDIRIYIIHFACAGLYLVLGYYLKNITHYCSLTFTPIIFLVLFKVGDFISIVFNKRHIVLRKVKSNDPIKQDQILDLFLDIIIYIVSIVTPIIFISPIR